MIQRPSDAEVTIVGLGVIGGSAALRLRERGTPLRAFSTSAQDCALASAAGIEVAQSLDSAVRDVGVVLIAVPLNRISIVASEVIGAAPATATILHAGSLQRRNALDVMPEVAARTIGTHPIAGSHRSGFAAARADLFRDATVYVERRASARQREDAELFWSLAGARRIAYADAPEHDAAMAWISHLPQLASKALADTLATAASHDTQFSPGPGARDTTRLAMSAYEMWHPILEHAPTETATALRAFEQSVERLRIALESRDWETMRMIWEGAGEWRWGLEQAGDG
ncbi:MAG TPA: prephenate dehydrogenase/arogenate dehydrogenase family protein [Gemmatimonadaceae bacterium]|nr:prephenate dehydrogenase/arogenate dehydrogenase family protein [Gemmatimonadaceae bacterium]